MIKKYRKKPVEIEAMRYTGDNDALFEFVGSGLICSDGVVLIETLEGRMSVKKGNYVIKGIEDEFYSCAASIFEASYEEVK